MKLIFTNKRFGIVLFAIFLVTLPAQAINLKQQNLISTMTADKITLDGTEDKAWKNADSINVIVDNLPYKPNNGYEGIKKTTVNIKSLYDEENIYFFVKYKDPTKSLERFPWVKQKDGKWKQLKNKDSTGHENTYYEDKFAMYWEIKSRGFKKKGCDIACHMSNDGKVNNIKDSSAGRKYTRKSSESIDMWHWKSVRTNPLGQIDDQFVDSTKDPKLNKNWGRKGDDKTGGGYENNVAKDGKLPMFDNSKRSSKNKYWVMQNLKTKFKDNFTPGDVVPGVVISTFDGHRGDIKVFGHWVNGEWVLEISRKLVTKGSNTKIQDVQFNDLSNPYFFGVAVFDNTQINHVYHKGSIALTFKK
jgi:hypothetical protein